MNNLGEKQIKLGQTYESCLELLTCKIEKIINMTSYQS